MLNLTSFVFFGFTLIFSMPAYSDCREVRLDADGGSMKHVPVRDQGVLPVCYAVTASQMADAWRFSHGDTDYFSLSSPLEIAVMHSSTYNTEDDPHYVKHVFGEGSGHGGDVEEAIWYLKGKKGMCLGKNLDKFGGKTTYAVMSELFRNIQYIKAKEILAEEDERKAGPKVEDVELKSGDCIPRSATDSVALSNEAKLILSKLDHGRIGSTGDFHVQLLKGMQAYFTQLCKDTRKPFRSEPKISKGIFRFPKEFGPKVSAHFDTGIEGTQPLAVNYCRNFLSRGSEAYIGRIPPVESKGGPSSMNTVAPGCNKHFSVIIGRRPGLIEGKCQYLIQDSFGTGCGMFPRGMDCEGGKVWVDEDRLANNAMAWVSLGSE